MAVLINQENSDLNIRLKKDHPTYEECLEVLKVLKGDKVYG